MSDPAISQTNPSPANVQLLNLSDILQTVQRSWRLIFGVVLFSVFLSFLLTLILPKKWQASATVQIAKTSSETGELTSIENLLQTVERLKLVGFKEEVLQKLKLPTTKGRDDRSDILLDTLTARPINNTEFITISVSAYSQQDAIKSIQSAITELQATHDAMTLPTKNRLIKELQTVNESLSITDRDISTLNHQMSLAGVYQSKSAFAPTIVAINLLEAKESTRRVLQRQQAQLNTRLLLLDELSTKSINTIHSSGHPIFPKRIIFLILGALLGLLSSIGFVLCKEPK